MKKKPEKINKFDRPPYKPPKTVLRPGSMDRTGSTKQDVKHFVLPKRKNLSRQGETMNEYEEESWIALEAKQMQKKVDNINKILNLIEGGSLAEGEKASDLVKEILEMQKDAMRYRWLTKYTCQLFMVTERQMNDQIDAAMTGVRK
jgi:hypothetical protein